MRLGMKEELIYAIASRAQRCGLIYPMSGIGGFSDTTSAGNLIFRASPLDR
jgi:hypothetical protein